MQQKSVHIRRQALVPHPGEGRPSVKPAEARGRGPRLELPRLDLARAHPWAQHPGQGGAAL